MAKRKVNKSQAIRDYVVANPAASAKSVVAALGKKGIKVTPSTVANVKSKSGLSKARGGSSSVQKPRGRRPASAAGQFPMDVLIEAKRLRSKAGSVEKALEALRAIDQLESVS